MARRYSLSLLVLLLTATNSRTQTANKAPAKPVMSKVTTQTGTAKPATQNGSKPSGLGALFHGQPKNPTSSTPAPATRTSLFTPSARSASTPNNHLKGTALSGSKPNMTSPGRLGTMNPGESHTSIEAVKFAALSPRGINRHPLPPGTVIAAPGGGRVIAAAGGRSYVVRPNGSLLFYSRGNARASFSPRNRQQYHFSRWKHRNSKWPPWRPTCKLPRVPTDRVPWASLPVTVTSSVLRSRVGLIASGPT